MAKKIEIMDTTLRDGEQMKGVSYSPKEKLTIAKILIEEVKVDRIEIASARVSKGEEESVREIMNWARKTNRLEQVEILGFVDHAISIDWIDNLGGKVINILSKGSLKHLSKQLSAQKKARKLRALLKRLFLSMVLVLVCPIRDRARTVNDTCAKNYLPG